MLKRHTFRQRVVFTMLAVFCIIFSLSYHSFKYFFIPRILSSNINEFLIVSNKNLEAISGHEINSGDWYRVKRIIAIINSNYDKFISSFIYLRNENTVIPENEITKQSIIIVNKCSEQLSSSRYCFGTLSNGNTILVTSFPNISETFLISVANNGNFEAPLIKLFRVIFWSLLVILIIGYLLYVALSERLLLKPIMNLVMLMRNHDPVASLKQFKNRNTLVEIDVIADAVIGYIEEKDNALKTSKTLEKQAAIAQMTQMLAHDVRKPFSSIKMILSAMAKMRSVSEVKAMTSFAIPEINRSMETVNGLIQDVMEIGSHSLSVTETIDICDLIDRALTDIFREYTEASVTINYSLKHTTSLSADKNKVLRVFSNIIGNAIQAMGLRGNISIATRDVLCDKPMIEFTIANDGPHIPAESLPQLFDAFFTSGKKGGTGLGLAIAHKIVTAHGGNICCYSEPQKGVAFVFTLPSSASSAQPSSCNIPTSSADFIKVALAAQAFDADTSSEADETLLVEAFTSHVLQIQRKLVVLIADDERLYRDGLVEKLERHSEVRNRLEIQLATTPYEAFEAHQSDLAIVDVDLGCQDMNGFDVVSQLRKQGNQGIICTHSNRILASDNRTAIEHGADAFMPKPMSTVHVLKLLCQTVERVKEREGIRDTTPECTNLQNDCAEQPLKVAFVDDSKVIRMSWKLAWKDGELAEFQTPEAFWQEAESNPHFLNSLACVITDFDFGKASSTNGGAFANALRAKTALPIFLASDGEFALNDFNGAIDAILSKQPTSAVLLKSAIEKANYANKKTT